MSKGIEDPGLICHKCQGEFDEIWTFGLYGPFKSKCDHTHQYCEECFKIKDVELEER